MSRDTSIFRKAAIGSVMLWLAVFAVVPNMLVVIAGFLERDPANFVRFIPTLENFGRLMDPVFLSVFTNSFIMAAGATLLCLILGFPFAWTAARAGRRVRQVMLLFIILPFWTNSLIRTYSLVIILGANGLLNRTLKALGLIDRPLQILYTETSVMIGLVYTLLPFMILPLFASIDKLDFRYIEAARDLGAGPLRTFWNVVLPLTLPGIIAGSILVFLPALGMFYIPDFLGGAKTMLIGNFIKDQFLQANDWPFGSAASVVMTLFMGLLLAAWYFSSKRLKGRVSL